MPASTPGPAVSQGLSQMPPITQVPAGSTGRGVAQVMPLLLLSVTRTRTLVTWPTPLRARPMKVMRRVPSRLYSSTGSELPLKSGSVTRPSCVHAMPSALRDTPINTALPPPRAM